MLSSLVQIDFMFFEKDNGMCKSEGGAQTPVDPSRCHPGRLPRPKLCAPAGRPSASSSLAAVDSD
eukprot:2414985-Prymnesium_polylepis.1